MFRIFLFALFLPVLLSAQDFRYTEFIAPSATVTTGVVYGTAPFLNFPYSNENNTSDGDLVMDVYQPTGDAQALRPAIIFAHSGGFITGDRTHDDMIALCDSFARKGYVTATIDYRQGFYLLNNVDLHGARAVYRGLQDGRTAVRFLRANAAAYGVDPGRVYLAGSSAGSFIALQAIYLSAADEIPPEVGVQTYTDLFIPRTTPDLGAPDDGANLGFSGTPDAVVGLWGAVAAPDWVDPTDDQPVFLAHGSADETVPFTTGPPFSVGAFPDVYGSAVIAAELATNGTTDFETYFVDGGEHEFYGTTNGNWTNGTGPNLRWDTLLNRVTPFLWRQHKPTADFVFAETGLTVDFTDASTGATGWQWDFGDGNTTTTANPQHTFSEPGTYAVRLYATNEIMSYDTLTRLVTVDAALPLTWLGAPRAVWSGKDVAVSWSVADLEGVGRFVVEAASADLVFRSVGDVAVGSNGAGRAPLFNHLHTAPPRQASGTTAIAPRYYRIRAEDLDGTVYYSPIGTLAALGNSAWPNPTNGLLNLPSARAGDTALLSGSTGRTQRLVIAADGVLDLSGRSPGVYHLRVGGRNQRVVITD